MTATLSESIHTSTHWLPLLSLNEKNNEMHPYPINALPSIIQKPILTYQQYGQQPLPLIACSALANVSLACQTLANIARDRLLISPVSLFFILVGSSGERKSASDYMFGQAIRAWEQKIREKLSPEVEQARVVHQAWRIEKEAVLSQIRKATISGEDTYDFKNLFIAISKEEPKIPLMPMLFFEDATQEAITSHMTHGWPSASLWSDEGGIVLGNHGMQNNATKFISTLNRLWDGNAFNTHRKTTHSFNMTHRRLTVSLMIQPMILQQLLTRNNGLSRHSGFLARSLITYPESSMGERYYQEPSNSSKTYQQFTHRLTECLDDSLSLDHTGCKDIPILSFSSHAKKIWIEFFNAVEKGLNEPRQWSTIKDFASKAAENAARLATLFHLFEGKVGSVSPELTEQAIQIIEWHLWETRRILGTQTNSPEQQDANRLLSWIKEKALTQTTARQVQQFGPLREKTQRDNAIRLLISTNYIKEVKQQNKTMLLVNPAVSQMYG